MTTANPIITSPVLVPFTPDCEYQYGEEVLPPEKIVHLANSFNDYKIIDLQHEFTKRLINKLEPIPRGKLLNSYIATEDIRLKGLDGYIREYPKGTWIISVEITDPECIQLYNKGELTGLSVTVKEKEHADTLVSYLLKHNIPFLPEHVLEAEKGFHKKPKRILMKDVMNPVAFTVSLVKSPCVYSAKFCRNACLITNKDKLKENNILNLKEKIKKGINEFIDGMDVESIKEDLETVEDVVESAESEKSDVEDESVKTIYGRKVKVEESQKSEETESEAVKEDGEGSEGGSETTGGDGESTGEGESTGTTATTGEDDDNSNSQGKVKKEAQKEDVTETESDKEVLYLAQDDVENLISTTLRRYAEEIEQMVFDGIQEALDDYLFSKDYAYKEDVKPEEEEPEEPEEEEVEEESQKEYATPEMVQSMFDEQFASFKSTIMDGIKEAQKESIKSYSKAINQSNDGFVEDSKKEVNTTHKVDRDFNGCRIRKRR